MSTELLSYIDPGTGAILIQLLIATAVSIGVFFRKYLMFPFRAILNKNKHQEDD